MYSCLFIGFLLTVTFCNCQNDSTATVTSEFDLSSNTTNLPELHTTSLNEVILNSSYTISTVSTKNGRVMRHVNS